MYGLWIVCLCGVCNFSYFFCENVTYQLWLVCGLVFFSYGCSPPQLIVCWLWGVCLLFKGAWWMPWYAGPMKDVYGCVKRRGVVNGALIRGCPNGETRLPLWVGTC